MVVLGAQRYGAVIRRLGAHATRIAKPDVVGVDITGPLADGAGVGAHERQVLLVAKRLFIHASGTRSAKVKHVKTEKVTRLPVDFPSVEDARKGSVQGNEGLQAVAKAVREAMARGNFSILLPTTLSPEERSILEAQGFTLTFWPPMPHQESQGGYRLSWAPRAKGSESHLPEESPQRRRLDR